MSVQSDIIIISNDDMSQIKVDTLSPKESVESLVTYLNKLALGCGAASVNMKISRVGGVSASGTVTFASLANNDTITVGSQVFTAKTSGATGTNQFNLGANDTAAATAFASAVNANPSLVGVVTATSALAVTTIAAVAQGPTSNMIALAISAHGSVSGAFLSGGVSATSNLMHCGL